MVTDMEPGRQLVQGDSPPGPDITANKGLPAGQFFKGSKDCTKSLEADKQ